MTIFGSVDASGSAPRSERRVSPPSPRPVLDLAHHRMAEIGASDSPPSRRGDTAREARRSGARRRKCGDLHVVRGLVAPRRPPAARALFAVMHTPPDVTARDALSRTYLLGTPLSSASSPSTRPFGRRRCAHALHPVAVSRRGHAVSRSRAHPGTGSFSAASGSRAPPSATVRLAP